MFNSPYYVMFIMFVIMPVNGIIIQRGDYILGTLLVVLHLPWFVFNIFEKLKR